MLFWDHSAANSVAGQSLPGTGVVNQGFYGLKISDLHAADNGILVLIPIKMVRRFNYFRCL